MTPIHISAFSRDGKGGNPAGVVIQDVLPPDSQMQALARDLGYSESVFASPTGPRRFRVRYFAPAGEIAFCGHATIALGASLGALYGAGTYDLILNDGPISVTAEPDGQGGWQAALQSPPTGSRPLDDDLLTDLLNHFGWQRDDLDPRLPPRLAKAGANQHPILTLRDRQILADMSYPFDAMRDLMDRHSLTTVSLLHIHSETEFTSRNVFAIGGVVEDAATGSAAAALGGALVDMDWPQIGRGGRFTLYQGDDMGQPSTLFAEVTGIPGDPVRISGATRLIEGRQVAAA